MKIKVRELKEEVLRKRTGGEENIKYKILSVEGVDLNVKWKVIDIDNDLDEGNKLGGTFYLTEFEYGELINKGVEFKKIPVDESMKGFGIPLPEPGMKGVR